MSDFNPGTLSGIQIIESQFVPEFNYKTVRRTWKERLFSRPWRPLQKTKTVKSGPHFILSDFGIIVHPSTAAFIRRVIA